MALRFIQLFLPEGHAAEVDQLLEGHDVLGVWRDANVENKLVVHLLVPAQRTEPIMDDFEQRFGSRKGFHVVVFPVEAVLPRPAREPDAAAEPGPEQALGGGENGALRELRVSREELYNDVAESLGVNRVFVALTALSALVAALGLVRDDVAVVIGAMVIAPLLGPNVAMSLAVTLGDISLLRRAIITNLAGVATAFGVAVIYGFFVSVDPDVPAIAARLRVDFGHIPLALAAGTAGTLAYTKGLSGAIIGVMVAVALVPPLVVFGMLCGKGEFGAAWGALLMTAVNVICIELAGTLTFAVHGVRPRAWWEAKRATKATRHAIVLWLTLLVLLILIMVFSDQ